ncbi:MAG: hypothetical protein ABSH06_28900 [Thermodesulfobacteriota bacterium]|jgi:hypothetical protein
MENSVTSPGKKPQPSEYQRRTGEWVFRIGLLIVGSAILIALFSKGVDIFKAFVAHLPLILPLAVTILSILTRAPSIRDFESVLMMSNDIAIGIISFDVWAFSASRNDAFGRILVNPTTMIRGDFALPFLVLGLFVALGCVVLTRYPYQKESNKRRWLLIIFMASVVVYLAPFSALEPLPQPKPHAAEIRQFTVAIPYQDPRITRIAPALLGNKQLVHFEKNIEATNASDARTNGIQRFMASSESNQIKSAKGDKVIIQQENVLVVGH